MGVFVIYVVSFKPQWFEWHSLYVLTHWPLGDAMNLIHIPWNYSQVFDDQSALDQVMTVGQQAITWANVDPHLCRHVVSLGYDELLWFIMGWRLTYLHYETPLYSSWTGRSAWKQDIWDWRNIHQNNALLAIFAKVCGKSPWYVCLWEYGWSYSLQMMYSLKIHHNVSFKVHEPYPTDTWRDNSVIITSKRRCNDILT